MPTAELPRRCAWPLLAGVLALGLGLRVWGIRQGLPYSYNADEADHFVPRAVHMFGHGLDPHYFANPPAFTYFLHYLFAIAYGGGHGVVHTFALHPARVYTLARAATAALGVLALWLTYLAGARLIGRAAGLLAVAIEAVAFLPVYYSHLAVNDVPTLAPLTLSLVGTAGVLRRGRTRDCLLAGVGLGLACASKYTAGIALVPLLAALAARYLHQAPGAGRRALRDIALAGGAAVGAFLVANPYAVLDYASFHSDLVHQSTLSSEAQGKLGAPRHGGLVYYLWSLTWGLGWAPTLAALGGALTVWRREPALGWVLVPAPLLFLIFMGLQGRYFGRWLMPVLPILCLLAALFTLEVAGALAQLARRAWQARAPREGTSALSARRTLLGLSAAVAAAALAGALITQGLTHGIHTDLVLSRADTRNLTRAWMLAHVPARAPIVAEPVSPDEWAREARVGTSSAANPYQWEKYPSLVSRITPTGALDPHTLKLETIENYERTLSPALISFYEDHRYCWVVSGSTQSGRAFADPSAVPHAIAYYRALARAGEVVYRASPYERGARPVAFGFDWSFNYYPLAYQRPGPAMTVYRLHGGRCRT
jgi:4-amino-4-deoxy-L-arabinose transferase-like glycosyltransferase